MAKNNSVEEVIPSAKRLINSLRSLGYEFPTAVAELIDNSIEANATKISIRVEFDGENSWVMIADDGKGMIADELKEAMRFGSNREYNEKSLGKFGLGLKTASFSQCKHWLVATRNNPSDPEIISFKWDLDHVDRTDRWEILPLKNKNLDVKVKDFLQYHTGTVVLWQRLDRILEYENPNSEPARKRITSMCRDLEEHLAMVFHRFLMGEISEHKLKIFLNDNEIQSWDPFSRSEKATKDLSPIRIPLEHKGVHGEIVIEPYFLPPQKAYSTPQAHSRAGGPKKWNQQQGFYVYRNNRMIQSGGWCRIRTYDEHTKLARFAVNFSSKLDDAFKIDISKMYVQLPAQIRKDIEDKVQPLVARAREIYDNDEKSMPNTPSLNTYTQPAYQQKPVFPNEPLKIPHEPEMVIRPDNSKRTPVYDFSTASAGKASHPYIIQEETCPTKEKMWTIDEIFQELKNTADSSEIQIIERVFSRLREKMQKNMIPD